MTKELVYTYEIIAVALIEKGKVYKGMPESNMIQEIYNETLARNGRIKTRYLMNVDEDFLSDCVSEINERLK